MCGIAGFLRLSDISDKEALKLSKRLLLSIEDRGRQASGIYTNNLVVKAAVPASVFIRLKIYPKKIGYITLLHARQATSGSPQVNYNNHPLISKRWVLIHNGVILNDRLKDYSYLGTVDSEVLLSYIETKGLKKALENLRGSAAIGVCKRYNPRSIFVWTNSNPISFGYVPNKALIFSSTSKSIIEACKMFGRYSKFINVHLYEPEKYVLYQFTYKGIRELGTYIDTLDWWYMNNRYAWYYRSFKAFKKKKKKEERIRESINRNERWFWDYDF